MTRCAYTDLTLPYTPSTTTFPTIVQLSADITNMYKMAAEIMKVTYSASVPDTDYLFGVIKAHVEAHAMDLHENVSILNTSKRAIHALVFSRDERAYLSTSSDSDEVWTIDSASKNEDIG